MFHVKHFLYLFIISISIYALKNILLNLVDELKNHQNVSRETSDLRKPRYRYVKNNRIYGRKYR